MVCSQRKYLGWEMKSCFLNFCFCWSFFAISFFLKFRFCRWWFHRDDDDSIVMMMIPSWSMMIPSWSTWKIVVNFSAKCLVWNFSSHHYLPTESQQWKSGVRDVWNLLCPKYCSKKRTMCKTCSKLVIETTEQRHRHCSGLFIANFEKIPHTFFIAHTGLGILPWP